MRTIQVVFALSLLVLVLGTGDPCLAAFKRCEFTFIGSPSKPPVFQVNTPPDVPFTPQIISKDPSLKIGILNTNGIVPEFITSSGAVPITHFAHPPFTPTHFKPLAIDYIMGSGIGHQTFQGNQKKVAWGKCVRVFFTTFQKLTQAFPMPVVDNVNVDRHANKCVVFRID